MGRILDGTDLGSTSTKLLSANEVKNLGWNSDDSGTILTDDAYFTVSWDGSDDGQSYVKFTALGFTIQQCKSTDTNYSTMSGGFNLVCSKNKSSSSWGSVSDSTTITPSSFSLNSPDAGYYVIITASGYPASYNYNIVYESRKVYMGTTVKAFIEKLKNSSIHVATEYLNGQISVHTNGLS